MTVEQEIRAELIRRAIALGDELVRLADDLGHAIAGNHISQGVELMREDIEPNGALSDPLLPFPPGFTRFD